MSGNVATGSRGMGWVRRVRAGEREKKGKRRRTDGGVIFFVCVNVVFHAVNNI